MKQEASIFHPRQRGRLWEAVKTWAICLVVFVAYIWFINLVLTAKGF